LNEIGYQLEQEHLETHQLTYKGQVNYVKISSGKKLVIDLHTDFTASSWVKVTGSDIHGIWDHLLEVKYNDFYIPHLPVNVYLFFLCLHCAAHHIFDRLINFCDIDLFIRKYEDKIEWESIAKLAQQHRSMKSVYHSLNYCRGLLSTPIPVPFLDRIKPTSFLVSLIPTRFLLLRNKKPPTRLYRYMHVILADDPFLLVKRACINLRRESAELFIK